MSQSKVTRRPQASKRARDLAKVAKIYAAGSGESAPVLIDGDESERDQ